MADDAEWMEKSRQIMGNTEKATVPDWLKSAPSPLDEAFRRILKNGNATAPGIPGDNDLAGKESPPQGSRDVGKWIFVSFSMPEQEIIEALSYASEEKATVVFRGIDQGSDLGSFIKKVKAMGRRLKRTPDTLLDPILFRKYQVDAVPAIVEGLPGNQAKSVKGMLNFAWLAKKQPGDYGVRGNIHPVQEVDFIEEMQKRMAQIDWKSQQEKSIQGYWQRHGDFVPLPEAGQDSVRRFDPSIVVTQDIRLADGSLLAEKGKRINPQQILPMKMAYIFFDATRKGQALKAREIGREMDAKGTPTVYVTSRIDADRGWEHIKELEAEFGKPVSLLTRQLAERFQIKRLPSLVKGDGDMLSINEYRP
ncbi:MAG: TrbC family F-type conjugative pilus assembly protein [Candidatus Methylumidiphilus sp.]